MRRLRDGGPESEIVLVHRPKYDDWSLPKGKLDPGEGFEEAALREVEEETGLRSSLGRELGETRYNDRKGRSKLVRYWLMTPLGGRFSPRRRGGRGRVDDPGRGAGAADVRLRPRSRGAAGRRGAGPLGDRGRSGQGAPQPAAGGALRAQVADLRS